MLNISGRTSRSNKEGLGQHCIGAEINRNDDDGRDRIGTKINRNDDGGRDRIGAEINRNDDGGRDRIFQSCKQQK